MSRNTSTSITAQNTGTAATATVSETSTSSAIAIAIATTTSEGQIHPPYAEEVEEGDGMDDDEDWDKDDDDDIDDDDTGDDDDDDDDHNDDDDDDHNDDEFGILLDTILSLNNTAVTLLGTHENYIAAIQTMKDALELLSRRNHHHHHHHHHHHPRMVVDSAGGTTGALATNTATSTATEARGMSYSRMCQNVMDKATQRIQNSISTTTSTSRDDTTAGMGSTSTTSATSTSCAEASSLSSHPSHNCDDYLRTATTTTTTTTATNPQLLSQLPLPSSVVLTSSSPTPPPSPISQEIVTADTPAMNALGVVVLSCHYHPTTAYRLLSHLRTSKVAIYLEPNSFYTPHCHHSSTDDIGSIQYSNNHNGSIEHLTPVTATNDYCNLHVIRSILVYNYGIAHRCCGITTLTMTPTAPLSLQPGTTTTGTNVNQLDPKLGTFCLQIFQYAEQLLLPALENHTSTSTATMTNPSSFLLLYRFVLTRNLMMTSCKLGMLLCELYKQTLDPIEHEILHLSQSRPTIQHEQMDVAQINTESIPTPNRINNNDDNHYPYRHPPSPQCNTSSAA
jgi:hypothetical protein